MAHLMLRVADRPKLAAAIADIDVDRDELDKLPTTAFAWPEKRAFPIHSAGHALMSRVYRENADNVPPHVDRALKEASEVYGLDESLLTRPKVAAAPEPDDVFLLPSIRRLRVTNAGQVKEAEERLRMEGKKLTPAHRVVACGRLVEKAAMYGVQLRPETHQLAGNVVTDTRIAADWVSARSEAAPIEHKASYTKVAETLRRMPAELRDRDTQVKIATTLDELDELAGLTHHYGKRLPDPAATVFNTTKRAGQGVNLAGRFVPLERLAAYDANFYSDALGPDFVREASDASGHMDPTRIAAVLETLPADMQRVLSAQIR